VTLRSSDRLSNLYAHTICDSAFESSFAASQHNYLQSQNRTAANPRQSAVAMLLGFTF